MSTPKTPKINRVGGGYGTKYAPNPIPTPKMTPGLADLVGGRYFRDKKKRRMNTPGLRDEFKVPTSVRTPTAYMAYIRNNGYTGTDGFLDIVNMVEMKNLEKKKRGAGRKVTLRFI